MPSAREVLVLASEEVGEAVVAALAARGLAARSLCLIRPRYRSFRFEPEAWDALVLGSIHGWRGLAPSGSFDGPCFVVGAKTAERLRAEAGDLLRGPVRVPSRQQAEGLVELIEAHFAEGLSGRRILAPRTERGRTLIARALSERAQVQTPNVYEMRWMGWPSATEDLAGAWAVVFGSGDLLGRVVQAHGKDGLARRHLFVFGPTAQEAARALGLNAEAPEAPSAETVAALVADRVRTP